VLSRFRIDAPQPRGIRENARALGDRSCADLEPLLVALGVISSMVFDQLL